MKRKKMEKKITRFDKIFEANKASKENMDIAV